MIPPLSFSNGRSASMMMSVQYHICVFLPATPTTVVGEEAEGWEVKEAAAQVERRAVSTRPTGTLALRLRGEVIEARRLRGHV